MGSAWSMTGAIYAQTRFLHLTLISSTCLQAFFRWHTVCGGQTAQPAASGSAPAEEASAPAKEEPAAADMPVVSEPEKADTIQREPLDTAAPVQQKAADTVQREPLKAAEPVKEEPAAAEMPVVSSQESAETIQREVLDTAAPAEGKTADTVQREPLKAAEPVREKPEAAEMPVVSSQESAETIQREVLDTAEPAKDTVQRESEKPVTSAKKTSKKASSKPAAEKGPAETIQREPLEVAKPLHEEPEKVEMPVVTEPVAENLVQREPLETAKPVREAPAKVETVSENKTADVIQREPLETAAPIQEKPEKVDMPVISDAAAPDVIQREPLSAGDKSEDFSSLLSSIPTHYEMPQEQIDAIRAGKSYSAPTVQREMDDSEPEKKQTENKAAAAVPSKNEVQREPDFVLPKARKESRSNSSQSQAEVQREMQPNARAQSFPGLQFGPKPGPNPTGSQSGPAGYFPGVSNSPMDNGNASGTIQREMEDSAPAANEKPAEGTDSPAGDKVDGTPAVKDALNDLLPEVTSKQLDALADKLLPRIKRIIRAETERSIFR